MVTLKKQISFALILFAIVLTSACSKDSESNMGIADINFEVIISDFEDNSNSMLKAQISNNVTTSQEIVIPFDGDRIISMQVKPAESETISTRNIAKISSSTESKSILYKILVFDAKNKLILNKEYNTSEKNIQLDGLNSDESYSFILYTLVNDKLPTLDINIGDSWNKAILQLSNATEVMISSLNNVRLTKGANTLLSEFKHTFTKVGITLNTADIGEIASVGNISMDNIYQNATINLSYQSTYPSNLSFSKPSTKYILNSLTQQGTNKSIYANTDQIIYVDGIKEHTLLFDRISITGDVAKDNISVPGLKLIPGKSYDIIITIKKPIVNSIQVGDISWGLGNLMVINNTYSIETSQAESGNYFYRDAAGSFYNTPAQNNDGPTRSGAVTQDLCKNLGEQWRTPTQSDVAKLEKFASWYSNSNKFVGTYKNNANVNVNGVYFGTTSQPSEANKNKYLFLPFAGAYNSGKLFDNGLVGYYWFNGQNTGSSFQFASGYMSVNGNGGADKLRANSVRCVKNN